MFKFGIIGCGWIAEKVYLPVLNSLENTCLYAIFDLDEKKLASLKEEYKIPVVSNNFFDFIKLPLDAVIIATPNDTHSYYTDCSLEYGKHVLCEKPVAFSKLAIEETIALAKKNNKVFFPALVNRFRKDVQYLKEKSCEIGKITDIEVSWNRKSGIPKLGSWITNKRHAGGGALIDIGTHIIDIGLMFIKEPKVKIVEAQFGIIDNIEKYQSSWNYTKSNVSLPVNVETYSCGKVLLNDVTMNYCVNWCADIVEDITCVKLCGEKGSIFLRTLFGFSKNYIRDKIELSIEKKNAMEETIFWPLKNSFAIDAFKRLLNAFVDSVEGRDNPFLKMNDALYVVEVIEELYRGQGDKTYVHRI